MRLTRFPVVSLKFCQDFSYDYICKSGGFSCDTISGVSIFGLENVAAALVVPLGVAVAFLALLPTMNRQLTYGSGPGYKLFKKVGGGRVINAVFFLFGLQLLLHQKHTGAAW